MIDFKLEAQEPADRNLTTCRFAVMLDGTPVWPSVADDGAQLEIQIDDLLSHLAEFWAPLVLRQTYPLSFNPDRPSRLRVVAETEWSEMSEGNVEAEDEVLEQFQDCHDLSRCFDGYFDLPPLWVVRSGETMQVDTGIRLFQVPYTDAVAALERIGDEIANRLDQADSLRWKSLTQAWHGRHRTGGVRLLSLATGLNDLMSERLASDGLLSLPVSLADAARDDDELRIAARTAGALPGEEIRGILSRLVRIPATASHRLEAIATVVDPRPETEFAQTRPYEQGTAMASRLRQYFSLGPAESVDIRGILQSLDIAIHLEDLGVATLDAIAVWGKKHGPAALVNSASSRHQGPGAPEDRGTVRVTMAHELCHFLIDHEHALGAVDILRSRMPPRVEQRARAFAAEFLLPTDQAAQLWRCCDCPTEAEPLTAVIDALSSKFRVSRSVASWKLEHAASLSSVRLGPALSILVPWR